MLKMVYDQPYLFRSTPMMKRCLETARIYKIGLGDHLEILLEHLYLKGKRDRRVKYLDAKTIFHLSLKHDFQSMYGVLYVSDPEGISEALTHSYSNDIPRSPSMNEGLFLCPILMLYSNKKKRNLK